MLFLLPSGDVRDGLVFCGARVGVRTGLVGTLDGVLSTLEQSESLRRLCIKSWLRSNDVTDGGAL